MVLAQQWSDAGVTVDLQEFLPPIYGPILSNRVRAKSFRFTHTRWMTASSNICGRGSSATRSTPPPQGPKTALRLSPVAFTVARSFTLSIAGKPGGSYSGQGGHCRASFTPFSAAS